MSRIGFSILSLVGLSACRSPFLLSRDAEGAVIKGPLDNAFVFYDYNFNGIWDSNEPFTKTEADGSFVLNGRTGYSFSVRTDETTIDASSGEAIPNIMLKAPSGSGVVTPTTTIMEETGLDGASVNAILGLPADLDPTQFNPFSEDADPEMALAAEKVAHQVMTTVTAISSAVEGTGASSDDAFSLAIASVGDIVRQKGEAIADDPNADVTLDFTNTDDIATITNRAVERVEETGVGDADSFKEMATTLVAAVSNVNNEIKNAKDLNSDDSKALFSLGSELNEQVKAAAEDPEGNLDSIEFSQADAVSAAAVEKATSLNDNLTDYSGSVIKGPLEDALVFLDYNADGRLNPGEPNTRTDDDGAFTINSARPDMSFTVITDEQTVDTSSGQILAGVTLKSPNGSSIVSPLTTLLVETDLSKEKLVEVLGLPSGIDPTLFNPFASSVDQTEALAVEISSHQIMATITAIATVIEGVDIATNVAFDVALEAFAEVVETKSQNGELLSSEQLSNLDEVTQIIDLAGQKVEERQLADLEEFEVDVELLASAISNVNSALATATDLVSQASIDLFSQPSQLNEQIQLFMNDPEGNHDQLTFAVIEDSAPSFEGIPEFQAGGRIHIDYAALEIGSEFNEIRFQFQNETGNSIYIYDYDDDGVATRLLDESQLNGEYKLYSIELSDRAYNQNRITYREDGTTESHTNWSNMVYGEHDFDFGKLSFIVTGGEDPQTDFTPPELISFTITENEVAAGKRFHIDYEVSEVDSEFNEIRFQFQNETGNSIYVYDYDNDGVATRLIDESQLNGEYKLYSIELSDRAYNQNRITYREDGTTESHTNWSNMVNGEHDFDFTTASFLVSGGREPQTDFTPPELISFTITENEVAAGKRFHIDYEVSEVDSEFNEIRFQFQNETGNSIYVYDYDNDGVATQRISDSQLNGEYKLYSIELSDRAYNQNRITYREDGTTESHTNWSNMVNGEHDFDFTTSTITVTEKVPNPDPQTDWTPPELNSLELRDTETAPNEKVYLDYNAFDSDSELNNVEFRFRNENGNTFYLNDQDDDGIATGQFGEWYQEGTYTLDYVRLSDKANSSNQITYYNDGTTRFWDGQNNSDVFGEHEFDFSGYSLVFDKQLPPQTDWTPPELISLGELSETEVTPNQKFNIIYSAFDADSEINNVEFRFRNENGNTFYLNDQDDDGIATGQLSEWSQEGTYTLDYIRLSDQKR